MSDTKKLVEFLDRIEKWFNVLQVDHATKIGYMDTLIEIKQILSEMNCRKSDNDLVERVIEFFQSKVPLIHYEFMKDRNAKKELRKLLQGVN